MKKLLSFLFALMVLSTIATAQKEGIVIYEETITMKFDDLPPEFAHMVPKEISHRKQLLFTETESLYKNLPKEENIAEEIAHEKGDVMIKMNFNEPDHVTYRNLESGKITEQQDLFGRQFLIQGKPEKVKWKVTSDQKKIAGYTCIKATHLMDTIPITAWFTPQIPVQNGPRLYGDLPGMILALDTNNGLHVTHALSVELRPLNDGETIEEPSKGKVISREKFQKLSEEKMKEMQEMGGGTQMFIHN